MSLPYPSPSIITTTDVVLGDTTGTPLSGTSGPINRTTREIQSNVNTLETARLVEHNDNGTHKDTAVVMLAGTQTITGLKTIVTPSVSGGTISNATITNPTMTGGTVTSTAISGGTIIGITNTNSTLITPMISGGTVISPQVSGGTFNNPTIQSFVNSNHNHSSVATGGYAKGLIIQTVMLDTGVYATSAGVSIIPNDNTIPQSGEGWEVMATSITPLSSTSKLLVEVQANIGSGLTEWLVAALFRDSDVSATKVGQVYNAAASSMNSATLTTILDAVSTSPTTIRVRIGGSSSTTLHFNGGSAAVYGGAIGSYIKITEIAQ